MATRVDPIEALRGAGRSTSRHGLVSRARRWWCFRPRSRSACCPRRDCSPAACAILKIRTSDFEQDRRTDREYRSAAGRLSGGATHAALPAHPRFASRIPGVSAVALCMYSPLSGNNWGDGIWVDGHPAPGPNDDNSFRSWIASRRDTLTPSEIPSFSGRGISEQDTATSRHVAVINEAFARKFFKNEDPIGKHFGRHGNQSLPAIRNCRHCQRRPLSDFRFRQAG